MFIDILIFLGGEREGILIIWGRRGILFFDIVKFESFRALEFLFRKIKYKVALRDFCRIFKSIFSIDGDWFRIIVHMIPFHYPFRLGIGRASKGLESIK